MSIEANKAIVRRFIEGVYNQGDLSWVDELIAPNYANEQRGIRGPEEYKQRTIENSNTFMADGKITIEEMIAEGDKVVIRSTVTGTHKGEFRGTPASDKSVVLPVIFIHRVEGGRVAERWNQADFVGLLQQIGATQI